MHWMWTRVAGRYVHIPKLIGSFLLIAAILMLFRATVNFFHQANYIRDVEACIMGVKTEMSQAMTPEDRMVAWTRASFCQNKAEEIGMYVPNDLQIDPIQRWVVLLGPAAAIFFWIAVLVFAILLYQTGKIYLPIEEELVIKEEKKEETTKKKSTRRGRTKK